MDDEKLQELWKKIDWSKMSMDSYVNPGVFSPSYTYSGAWTTAAAMDDVVKDSPAITDLQTEVLIDKLTESEGKELSADLIQMIIKVLKAAEESIAVTKALSEECTNVNSSINVAGETNIDLSLTLTSNSILFPWLQKNIHLFG